jgi:S-phase kinase-associated protein 1
LFYFLFTMADTLILVGKDGDRLSVTRAAARQSKTLRSIIEDSGDASAEIPIPQITGAYLRKIFEFCEREAAKPVVVPTPAPANEQSNGRSTGTSVTVEEKQWLEAYSNEPPVRLKELVLAADCLEIMALIMLFSRCIPQHLVGKTPAEARALFEVANDFTPEEEAQMQREMAWCEEQP